MSSAGAWRTRIASWILVACLAAAQQAEAESAAGTDAETVREAADDGTAIAVADTLARLDTLIAGFEQRIQEAWSQANMVLERADAAADPEEQMRLEELYGKMAAVAEGVEEQRSRLQALRDELAAAATPISP